MYYCRLGAFHVKSELYEKAMPFFDLASKIQPQEVKWQLMVASCYRRIGAYPLALSKYKEIHRSHPENVECLRYLVHICTDLGRKVEALCCAPKRVVASCIFATLSHAESLVQCRRVESCVALGHCFFRMNTCVSVEAAHQFRGLRQGFILVRD